MKVTGFPKATYYYWVNCFERVNKDELIEKEMLKIRQEHANAGYRPMSELLKQRGYHVNHKKVQRLMKKLGLRVTSYWHKSRKYNSYKGKVGTVAKNKLHRRFRTSIPHQKITTDTTEFKYYEDGIQKKCYLNPYIDLFNSEVSSYHISKQPSYQSIDIALNQALAVTSDCPYRRTFHSDQGWGYQMRDYVSKLKSHRIFQSMSRKGNCHDNSVMENFFGLLKQEIYYGHIFSSFEELEQVIVIWIRYYNTKRIKQKLNWMSPIQFRLNYQNIDFSNLYFWKGYNKLDTKLREIVERFIMARRKFDKQFKNSAVKLILEEGYSVKEVSQELEVHANSLYRWVQEVEEYGESAFPGNGTALANAQHKIKLLEKENRYLQEELELLKKFRVFLKRSK